MSEEMRSSRLLYSLGAALALVAAVFAVYSNVLSAPFVFDDNTYIVNNSLIRDLRNFADFSPARYVALLTFALNYAGGGLDPSGYHLTNVVVHGAASVLVFSLVLLTLRTPLVGGAVSGPAKLSLALFAALIFAVHPVQTQAVSYVTQRFASLATLLYLLSIVFYVRWRLIDGQGRGAGRGRALYVFSLVTAVLAMKTKEISFTLPLMVVLYDFVFFPTPGAAARLRSLAPFLLTMLIVPVTLFGSSSAVAGSVSDVTAVDDLVRYLQLGELATLSTWSYLLTEATVVVTYLRLLLWPAAQNLDYDYPLYESLFSLPVIASILFLSAVAATAVYILLRSRRALSAGDGKAALPLVASFGVLWFFIALSVESSVIPIKDVIFEHRLYLPNVGAVIFFGTTTIYFIERVRERIRERLRPVLPVVIFFAVVLPLAVAAHMRNEVWTSEVALWRDVVEKSPMKARGHYNLGKAYARSGMVAESTAEFERTLELDPGVVMAMNYIAVNHLREGRLDEALAAARPALLVDGDNTELIGTLGEIYIGLGRYADAEVVLGRGLAISDASSRLHINMGIVYKTPSRYPEALAEYEAALVLDQGSVEAMNNLGNVYMNTGMLEEAMERYRQAIALSPAVAEFHYNLGFAYGKGGEFRAARTSLLEAIRLDGDYGKAHKSLCVVEMDLGRMKGALEACSSAVRLLPGDAEAGLYLRKVNSYVGIGAPEDGGR